MKNFIKKIAFYAGVAIFYAVSGIAAAFLTIDVLFRDLLIY